MAVCSASCNSGTSTFSMSLGLASILNERDLHRTPPEGAVSRPALESHNSSHTNPARFPSLVSDTHYNPAGVTSPAVTLTLPTNSYNLIPSPSTFSERSERGQGDTSLSRTLARSSELTDRNNLTCTVPDDSVVPNSSLDVDRSINTDKTGSARTESNALSVINKLKSTGFSLYGYFYGNGPQGDDSSSHPEVSRPTSLPVCPAAVSMATAAPTTCTVSVAMATEGTSVPMVMAGGMPTATSESSKKSHLASLLSRRTAGSVISALTKYNRERPF